MLYIKGHSIDQTTAGNSVTANCSLVEFPPEVPHTVPPVQLLLLTQQQLGLQPLPEQALGTAGGRGHLSQEAWQGLRDPASHGTHVLRRRRKNQMVNIEHVWFRITLTD